MLFSGFIMGVCVCAQVDVKPEVFNIDHHYPESENRSVVAILYGEIGAPDFLHFHNTLKQYAVDGKIDYVLRHHVQVCGDCKYYVAIFVSPASGVFKSSPSPFV